MTNYRDVLIRLLKWSSLVYIGLALIHMSFNNTPEFSDLAQLVGGAVGGVFSVYGMVAFLANIREGETRKGVWDEIKKIFKKAFP